MLDVVLVAVILAFFLAGAMLVRALGRLISESDLDVPKDELDDEPGGSGPTLRAVRSANDVPDRRA
jgi:hypothetical protein